jgi:hypothetical protein
MSPASPLPADEVIKAALVKGFSEIFLDPVSLTVDPSRRVTMINGYEVGVLLPYNPELYDHRNKLSNVPPGATLYPKEAKFALATSYGLQKEARQFLVLPRRLWRACLQVDLR